MKAEALFHAKVDTLAYVEAMTLNEPLAQRKAVELLDALFEVRRQSTQWSK